MYRFDYEIKKDKSKYDVENDYVNLIIKRLKVKDSSTKSDLKQLLLLETEKFNKVEHYKFKKNNDLAKLIVKGVYNTLQPNISNFFSREYNFKICPYCGIDYINSYRDHLDFYKNFKDFILEAPSGDLARLKGVNREILTTIELERIKGVQDVRKKLGTIQFTNLENAFYDYDLDLDVYNHFTLDHVFPKEDFPLFQLSLYNFIPSCYTCNCKLKKRKLFKIDILPNSVHFRLDTKLQFKLLYKIDKVDKVDKIDKFVELSCNFQDLSDEEIKYLKEFKIIGRYNEYMDIITSLDKKAVKYNDLNIKQISGLLKITEDEIRKDVFGEDLINNNKDSFLFKLKSDILKIYNVK